MKNWKNKKLLHDRSICIHKTKKGNVGTKEETLLRAIFNEYGTAYKCSICDKWHNSKKETKWGAQEKAQE